MNGELKDASFFGLNRNQIPENFHVVSDFARTLKCKVTGGDLVVIMIAAGRELEDSVGEDCVIISILETILKPLPLVPGQRLAKVNTESLGLPIISCNIVLTIPTFTASYSYRPAAITLSTWVSP